LKAAMTAPSPVISIFRSNVEGIDLESMSVSIIIACHNEGEFLADAIESVLNQTHRPCEVIVVDDGSA
jgi:cellulose synthase/poly-beta-1,6-N-acetylglucosamine synthase-like glycosyltransferase